MMSVMRDHVVFFERKMKTNTAVLSGNAKVQYSIYT